MKRVVMYCINVTFFGVKITSGNLIFHRIGLNGFLIMHKYMIYFNTLEGLRVSMFIRVHKGANDIFEYDNGKYSDRGQIKRILNSEVKFNIRKCAK